MAIGETTPMDARVNVAAPELMATIYRNILQRFAAHRWARHAARSARDERGRCGSRGETDCSI